MGQKKLKRLFIQREHKTVVYVHILCAQYDIVCRHNIYIHMVDSLR